MRLSPIENKALLYAIDVVDGEVFLFGSRTNNLRKGGDVDILIYSSQSSYQLLKIVTRRYFSVCESKLDVVVVNRDTISVEQKAFIALQTVIRIK